MLLSSRRARRVASVVCVVSWFAVLGPMVREAAADLIYLKLGDIKGESTSDKHKDEIDIDFFSQSFDRPGSCSTFVMRKRIDRASPLLIAASLTGNLFARADISIDRERDFVTFLSFVLEQVRIERVDLGDSAQGGSASEILALSFEKLTITYRPQRPDGSLGPPVAATVTCTRIQ